MIPTARAPLTALGLACLLAFVWGPVLGLPAPSDLSGTIQRCKTASSQTRP